MSNEHPSGGSGGPGLPAAVLIVDDHGDHRAALRLMLAPLGVVVTEADSGRAALRAVLRQTFALILMDVRMPTMDGFETARLIRQRQESRRTPIIFLTGFAREDRAAIEAYSSGAVDFILKPVAREVLLAKVAVFVELFVQARDLQDSLDAITILHEASRDMATTTQLVLDNVADGILTVTGETGLIESSNRAARALFGYQEEELIGQPLDFVIAPARRNELRDLAVRPPVVLTDASARDRTTETVGQRQDGSTFPMDVDRAKFKLGERLLTLAVVRDISERKAYTESLERQALYDQLTGLPNRTLFGVHLLQALADAKRSGEPRAVLVMDLDGFKQVNDRLGHDRGDRLLEEVGKRLTAALRKNDAVARLGGDEFAILPGGATDLAAAAAVAWTVQQSCNPGFAVSHEIVHVSTSVGIAMFPDHGQTAAELLGRADAAMYVAKRSGGGHAVFDAEQEARAARQLALLVDLRQCIDSGEMVLHYQPKIDIGTRKLSGLEALLRWQHPTRGLLLACDFMPEVESTDLIDPFTRWVLNEALRQQRRWRDEGVDLSMAVNVSGRSLAPRSNLPGVVKEVTDTWATPPDRLILELSEGALIEPGAPEALDRLHRMGERLSIDDFGTGYSSLAYLQRLPVDEIKIDRSFVTSLDSDHDAEVIVRSTIDLAHNLNLTVVAEGVETENVLLLLSEQGCDAAQGYLLGRPFAADGLGTWMSESPYATPA
jgi:diguanylate cyclase (GGDEF)-like protein/PAS domain S-box-containing protein